MHICIDVATIVIMITMTVSYNTYVRISLTELSSVLNTRSILNKKNDGHIFVWCSYSYIRMHIIIIQHCSVVIQHGSVV